MVVLVVVIAGVVWCVSGIRCISMIIVVVMIRLVKLFSRFSVIIQFAAAKVAGNLWVCIGLLWCCSDGMSVFVISMTVVIVFRVRFVWQILPKGTDTLMAFVELFGMIYFRR